MLGWPAGRRLAEKNALIGPRVFLGLETCLRLYARWGAACASGLILAIIFAGGRPQITY